MITKPNLCSKFSLTKPQFCGIIQSQNKKTFRSLVSGIFFVNNIEHMFQIIVKGRKKEELINTNNCSNFSGHITVCAQCGYRFVSGDDALWVKETGDVVHKDCFGDYIEDNAAEFTESIEF